MTFENSKRLYAHFLSIGNKQAASELLSKYPDLEKKQDEPKEEKQKPKKAKKEKTK